jgi:c-di-GMP-binding flagellar brake protein YcgR
MLRERRRYFRHAVKMPVAIILGEKSVRAASTNISEGGIALLLQHALPKNAKPRLQFTLPGTATAFDLEAEIAWMDLRGNAGLRFVNFASKSQELLEGWLSQQVGKEASSENEQAGGASPSSLQ